MQVDEDALVAAAEVYPLREEHRCVAMGVEGQYATVHVAGLTVVGRLTDEPPEKRHTIVAAQTLRMPLDAHDALELTALDGLDDTVGRLGGNAKAWSRVADGLVVEGVDV